MVKNGRCVGKRVFFFLIGLLCLKNVQKTLNQNKCLFFVFSIFLPYFFMFMFPQVFEENPRQ